MSEAQAKPLQQRALDWSVERSRSQRLDGIDPGGAPCWQETGDERHNCHDDEGETKGERIARPHLVKQVVHQSRKQQRDRHANKDSTAGQD